MYSHLREKKILAARKIHASVNRAAFGVTTTSVFTSTMSAEPQSALGVARPLPLFHTVSSVWSRIRRRESRPVMDIFCREFQMSWVWDLSWVRKWCLPFSSAEQPNSELKFRHQCFIFCQQLTKFRHRKVGTANFFHLNADSAPRQRWFYFPIDEIAEAPCSHQLGIHSFIWTIHTGNRFLSNFFPYSTTRPCEIHKSKKIKPHLWLYQES